MLEAGYADRRSPPREAAAASPFDPGDAVVARRWRSAAGLAVVGALACAVLLLDARPFLSQVTLTGRGDNASFNFPIRLEVARQWSESRLPLWNPYQFAGFPLLGDITSAALYPGNLPFVLDPDSPRYRALDHVAALHFVVAALCMYAFARSLALGRAAASLAALVYAGNGFLLFLAGRWIQAQNSAVWLPLVLAAVVRAGGSGSFGMWVGIGALAVALQTLSGYPQYVFYTGLIAGALALVQATIRGRSDGRVRPIVAVTAIYGLGAALAAVQLLPTIELAALSRRGSGVSLHEFLQMPVSPDMLASLSLPRMPAVLPHPYVVMGGLFVGTLTIVLALEGARSRSRLRVFFTVTLVVGFLLAIGPSSPIGTLAYHIPGLNAFRYPFKHVLEIMLCIAALAGFGAQALLDGRRGARTSLACGALLVGGWALSIRIAVPTAHWVFTVSAVGALLFALLVLLDWRRTAMTVAIACVWLTLAGNRNAVFLLYPQGSPATQAAAATMGQHRGTVLGPRYAAAAWILSRPADAYTMLALDYPTEFRVPSVNGTSPFLWGPLRDALSMSEDGQFTRPRVVVFPTDQTLDVLGVRYIGSTQSAFGGRVIQDLPRDIVAERARALPVLRFVDRVLCADSAVTAEELHRRRIDFGAVALLDCEGRPPLPEIAAGRMGSRIALLEGTPGHLRMRAQLHADAPAVLVVSQSDMPGWHARVDGTPVPIYRAYGIVQAIVVPPGVHDVRLDYLPRSFVVGSAISLAALIGGLGVCLVAHRRSRRTSAP